jgi:tyrosyl-tRNA synthetase
MTNYKSDFVQRVIERQYLHQCTDLEALDAEAEKRQLTAYIGFDCTAPSLHAGSLVSIMPIPTIRPQAHRIDGGRDDTCRRPVG